MMRKGPATMLAATAALVAAALPQPALHAQDGPGGETNVAISSEGQAVYQQICQACHMADARGGSGAGTGIPALADNPRLADKAYAIEIMVKGRGGMPWFTDILSAQQIAAVLTHVRGNFNAYPEPVTADEVAVIIASAGGSSEQ
jgi:mono/diheme cytochrome c family protein